MSELHKKVLGKAPGLRTLPPKAPPSAKADSMRMNKNKRDYTPLPWSDYFDRSEDIETENGDKFRVYVKGNYGPVVFFLHGGGFSALTWSLLSSKLTKRVRCQCYCMDIRGHGIFKNFDSKFLAKLSFESIFYLKLIA